MTGVGVAPLIWVVTLSGLDVFVGRLVVGSSQRETAEILLLRWLREERGGGGCNWNRVLWWGGGFRTVHQVGEIYEGLSHCGA